MLIAHVHVHSGVDYFLIQLSVGVVD